MATRRIVPALILLLALLFAGTAQAQSQSVHFGPRLSYQFDAEAIGLGAQLSVPIASHVEFYPSFDVFFVDPGSLWSLNVDLKWRVAPASASWLYLGTGLNIMDGGGDSQAGLNLFGGIQSLKGQVHPFAEMRFVVNDNSTAQLAAGLNFVL
ncbi:MAG: hypothetical protein R2910_02235 [Gemmatimonadales bacterium]|jgi:hypothetical protein